MRVYNNYILSLVLSACLINAMLAFSGQDDLAIYFITNIVAYLVITLLYAYLTPRARQALNTIGAVSFAGFMVVVALKAIEMWAGR